MMTHRLLTIINMLLLISSTGLCAEPLRWLTLRDGLPGMSVTMFCEDPSGKMWIGTSNGVSLFNGVSFKNYSLPKSDNEQLGHCHDIAVDKDGDVWTVTRNGVYRLERHADRFERVVADLRFAECVLPVGDSVYVGSRTGLYLIERRGEGVRKAKAVNLSIDGVHENNVVRCLRYQNGRVWLTLRNSIVSIDHGRLTKKQYRFFTPSGLSRFDISGNRLFVGTKNNGLYVFDVSTGESHQVEAVPNVINDVHFNDDGTLCVASDGNGAYLIDTATEQVLEHYGNDDTGKELPTDVVYTFRRTKDNMTWIGMYQSGMAIGMPVYQVFEPYGCGAFSTRGMKVTASLVDGDTRLVAVTGGFYIVDCGTGRATFHDTARMRMLHITGMICYGGAYYIASYDGGLLRFDIATGRIGRLPGYKQLEYASVMGMRQSPDGDLWAATSEGLFIIGKEGVKKNYTEKNSKLPPSISNIWFDRTGNAWIGGSDKPCLWLAADREFKSENFSEKFFNTATGLNFVGRGDSIYVRQATSLYRTDAAMSRFEQVTLPPGVLEEKCFDVTIDTGSVKFIVSERGLFRIDSRSGTAIHLSTGWGIAGNIVLSGTLGVDSNSVWVGTNDGLMVADKRDFSADSLAKIRIPIEADEVVIGARELTNGELLTVNDRHELRASWNFVAQRVVIKPAPADFMRHWGDIYEYRTDGDGSWRVSSIGQAIELDDLTPGRHKLYIRMLGLASTTVCYDIYVYPSVLFCIEMAVLTLALLLLYLWRRGRKRTNLLLSEHVETENALIKEIKELTPAADGTAVMQQQDRDGGADTTRDDSAKYQKSRTSDKELARLFKLMDEYVKEKKPYLDKDSKMSDIATALDVSPSMLSQVFTLYVKEPYYDYINKYRLEEFKRLIRDGKHKQFTITALSERCGFKKTSFFSTFRKVEGTTPTEWIQKRTEKK